jgi:hypothetical protein
MLKDSNSSRRQRRTTTSMDSRNRLREREMHKLTRNLGEILERELHIMPKDNLNIGRSQITMNSPMQALEQQVINQTKEFTESKLQAMFETTFSFETTLYNPYLSFINDSSPILSH